MTNLRIEDRILELEDAGRDDRDRLIVHIDCEPHVLEIVSARPPAYTVLLDGGKKTLFAVKGKEGVWVWHDGRARLVERAVRTGAGAAAGPQEVTPAMPSVVMRVLVEVGQGVEAGQDCVVVSAMKMESVLCAPYAGVVETIDTQEGANVKPGDILVKIKRAEPDQE